jgi:hypothetical protein
MMTRDQRIEFEILDCTLNRDISRGGWETSLEVFLLQVRELFPDVEPQELIAAFKRMALENALTLFKVELGPTYRDHRGEDDDEVFFRDRENKLRLQGASLSRPYFAQLAALIELPRRSR